MSIFRCVVFTVSHHKFALPLECVERVVRAVEVTPLPDAPATNIMGVINVQGQIVPVVDTRPSLPGLSASELDLNDELIIARNGDNLIAIVANTVNGVAEFDSNDIVASESLPHAEIQTDLPHGIIATGDDIITVRHPAHFLPAGEQTELAAVLDGRKST